MAKTTQQLDLVQIRQASHYLHQPFSQAKEVVEHFGCMQAQDVGQAYWSIGARLQKPSEQKIDEAWMNGDIIRCWPMRGTLHWVAPQHVRWLLALCASKTLSAFPKRREFLGITNAHAEKALKVMEKVLTEKKVLSRTEIGEALKQGGIPMQTQWTYHLTCYASTLGLICFGPPTPKEETFVLLEKWIKPIKKLSDEEQLKELARMYVRGHGPVTADDLAWWTGLGKTISREAFSLIESECEQLTHNKQPHFFIPTKKKTTENSCKLLSGFDEYFLGYKDRTPVSDLAHHKKLFTTNGIFFPLLMRNGTIVGTWKKENKKGEMIFYLTDLLDNKPKASDWEMECKKLSSFWGVEKFTIKFT